MFFNLMYVWYNTLPTDLQGFYIYIYICTHSHTEMAVKYLRNKKICFWFWKIIAHYYNNGFEEDIYIYIYIYYLYIYYIIYIVHIKKKWLTLLLLKTFSFTKSSSTCNLPWWWLRFSKIWKAEASTEYSIKTEY